MKLKYYLRGLGIGIVVTVFVMMAALGNKQSMTDEEVMARAKELGMIENSVLKDIAGKDDETTASDDKADETMASDGKDDETTDNDTQTDEVEADASNDVTEPKGDAPDDVTEPEDDKQVTDESDKGEESKKNVVSITVVSGDSSWTVSKRMEEAGLIESAKDFDTHLCRYGYDKKISVGTYEIPTTATHEEMAKILTKED